MKVATMNPNSFRKPKVECEVGVGKGIAVGVVVGHYIWNVRFMPL